MSALELEVAANAPTLFDAEGALDEESFRAHIERMADAGVAVFVGSPGSGQVHSLDRGEFRRVCELAVETAGRRSAVYSMTPELFDVDELIEWVRAAAAAGVNEVQWFQLMGGHGMKPTRDEQLAYWRRALGAVEHPTAISLHSMAGYLAPADLVVQLCEEFQHVSTVYVSGGQLGFLLELRASLPGGVRLAGGLIALGAQGFALGMTMLSGTEPNLVPRTARAVADAYAAGDTGRLEEALARVGRLFDALRPWSAPNGRSLPLALRALGLPGGNSTVRPPLLLPGESDFAKLAAALDALGVREWEEELSRA